MVIPDRYIAFKNLTQSYNGAYKTININKVRISLEPWVSMEAEKSKRVGQYYLLDDGYFTYLCWKVEEPFVSRPICWRKLAGPIRNQHQHQICWSYVVSDLVSIKLVLCGWEDEYVPLCPWFLSYFTPNDNPSIKPDPRHLCRPNFPEDCLKYIQKNGVPKENPKYLVFDCTKRPPSADHPKFMIKSLSTIETLEKALEELKTQPVGAKLIEFSGLFSRGRRIYYGPHEKGAKFNGYHAVVMVGVEVMDGELVAVCKMSNGTQVADGGYAYVSLSVVYMVVAADPEQENRHEDTPSPQHLLFDFYYAEMDQAPPNRRDRGGSSKAPR